MFLTSVFGVLIPVPSHFPWVEVLLLPAAGQHPYCSEATLHPGGDGSGPDGAQPVQRKVDGTAGGCQVDGDDQVRMTCLVAALEVGLFFPVTVNSLITIGGCAIQIALT